MPLAPGYKVVDGIKYLVWGDSQYDYTPSETCPMPKTEQLSKYLLDVFVALNAGEFDIVAHDPAYPCPSTEMLFRVDNVAAGIGILYDAVGTMTGSVGEMRDSLVTINVNLESLVTINLSITSLVEKITLLQADISAVKLQIDKLYIDTINVATEVSGDKTAEAIEKAFLHTQGETKYAILNTALLRPFEAGDEELRKVGDMVSHVETIAEDLVSLEMTEPTVQIAPGTLVYARSKVVRE